MLSRNRVIYSVSMMIDNLMNSLKLHTVPMLSSGTTIERSACVVTLLSVFMRIIRRIGYCLTALDAIDVTSNFAVSVRVT